MLYDEFYVFEIICTFVCFSLSFVYCFNNHCYLPTFLFMLL